MAYNNVYVDVHVKVLPEPGTNEYSMRKRGHYISPNALVGQIQNYQGPRMMMEGTEYADGYVMGLYPSRYPLLSASFGLSGLVDWIETHEGPDMVHTFEINRPLSNVASVTNRLRHEQREAIQIRGYIMGVEPGDSAKENPSNVSRYMILPTEYVKKFHLRHRDGRDPLNSANLPVDTESDGWIKAVFFAGDEDGDNDQPTIGVFQNPEPMNPDTRVEVFRGRGWALGLTDFDGLPLR